MGNKSPIITEIVEQDLCIGCGICSAFSNGSLAMDWNNDGFLVPNQKEYNANNDDIIHLCPFNPSPKDKVRTEDEIAALFQSDATFFDKDIGRYEEIYVGYSNEFRLNSSSGGMATFIFSELFKRKVVDAIIVVRRGKSSNFYEYDWINSLQDIKKSSKTRYYPVTMEKALMKIKEFEGKVAIVGVGCFLKGIRLLQHYKPLYREKIVFLVGIICGGLKSKYYSDYLSFQTFGSKVIYKDPEYRIKEANSSALDYSFGAKKINNNDLHTLKMNSLGDMWGTGLFKAKACDFCEDVTTELADISLGDAWLEPYKSDGNGNSVIITRSLLAQSIIQDGIGNETLCINNLSLDTLKESQRGSFNHRHSGLKFRMKIYENRIKKIPPKRQRNLKNIRFSFKLVQLLRLSSRKYSIIVWKKYPNAKVFDIILFPLLKSLSIFTKINRRLR